MGGGQHQWDPKLRHPSQRACRLDRVHHHLPCCGGRATYTDVDRDPHTDRKSHSDPHHDADRGSNPIHHSVTDCHSSPHRRPLVHVRGNQLVDQNGNVVRMLGVNRSGAEYACAEGWGLFDGPTDTDAAIAAMRTWDINAVRLPLNEDCWLGINGVLPQYGGVNYQNAIVDYVNRLNAHGILVVLNLHFSAPGTTIPDNQWPMADEDHSPAFWTSVATVFHNNQSVVFDLFNEPNPDGGKDSTAAWSCVLNGGICAGISYQTAGMQQLVNVVRATGATQPLLIAGPQYAGDLDAWLQYEPVDPVNQLIASVHIYEPNYAPCASVTCWNTVMAPLATVVPVRSANSAPRIARNLDHAAARLRRRPRDRLYRVGVERRQLHRRAIAYH